MLDYCDTPDERAKNPDAKLDLIRIANGDADALEFLWRFWCFEHCFDDLIDKDKPVDPEAAVRTLVQFIATLSFNAFYEEHKESLFPMIVMMANRSLDGDEWARSEDPAKRSAASVVRCGDVDLFLHVAFLTGGWDHMRSVKDARSYDSNVSNDEENV